MPSEVTRRGLLGAGTAVLAGLAGCPSGRSDPATDSPTPSQTATPTTGCDRPVVDAWNSVDESPTTPPCPRKPDSLDPCAVREYVLGLEKHLRYSRSLRRYDTVRRLEFGVYEVTVRPRQSGVVVHAKLFFSGDTASETSAGGTPTPNHFDDTYAVSYLVTPEGQWRATDRTGVDRASQTPRADGSPVTCVGDRSTVTPVDGRLSVKALSVADFVLYPLSGTHPHVHRRSNTQYVVVRADTSFDAETVRERLTLELDGESAPLADRQPVPWENDTVDVAFAVRKDRTVGRGRVLFDDTVLQTLSESTVDRLNEPPAFEVSEPSVPTEKIRRGERTSVTVRFELANTGEGAGTFGASLSGNFLSGSETITATLEPGARREITASVRVVGNGEEATVRLDWGSGEWSTGIPVVGTQTGSETETPTPGPQ